MAIYTFGSGSIWAVRTDVANATPIRVGDLQEATVEFSSTSKTLYGSNQFAIAAGRGESKITGKLKFARQQARLLSDLYFGAALQNGQLTTANAETAVAAATVSVANSATWSFDNGVVNASNGLPLVKVAKGSTPASGQYISNGDGTYSFSTTDVTAGLGVRISYAYSVPGATPTGQRFSGINQQQGIQPAFQVTLEDAYQSPTGLKKSVLILYACIAEKLNLAGKTGDFKQPELDFSAIDPGTGVVFDWSFNEAS